MRNKDALEFFGAISQNNDDPKSVKLAHVSDFSQMDADFILRYANSRTRILDLGSGTGLVLNKIYDKVGNITAVEPFEAFSKFIVKSGNVTVINKTFDEFLPEEATYDL